MSTIFSTVNLSEVHYVMTVHVVGALPRPNALVLSVHSPEVEFPLQRIYMTWELLLSDLFLDLEERDVRDGLSMVIRNIGIRMVKSFI